MDPIRPPPVESPEGSITDDGGRPRGALSEPAKSIGAPGTESHTPLPPADLLRVPTVADAVARIRETDARTVEEQVRISETPAPPFQEGARASLLRAGFTDAGLRNVRVDRVGNVLGLLGGRPGLEPVVLSAHLDTVFPAGTDHRVRKENGRLVGPGITDDSRGLAALLATARSLVHGAVRPRHPILFAATVGEEGPGNLRGVKHLFGPDGAARGCHGFISLDGAGLTHVVTRGIGSTRLRFGMVGPGGHSWGDWGQPNPLHALARGVARAVELPLPVTPRTTLTVARWGGGHAINAIPGNGWVEMDLRSEDEATLAKVEGEVRRCIRNAVEEGGRTAGLELRVEEIGRRPAGATDPEHPLVQAAVAASRHMGVQPRFVSSSTDANVPMAEGVPALTMGAGGHGGRAHTVHEWYRNNRGWQGVVRAALTALAVAGIQPADEVG